MLYFLYLAILEDGAEPVPYERFIMTIFYSNIINVYGEKGKQWLNELPKLIKQLSLELKLHDLKEAPNLSYHYVLSGWHKNKPIILKLGLDAESLKKEATWLKYFSGHGAVKLFAEDTLSNKTLSMTGGMLLLEKVISGMSLKSHFPNQELASIQITCQIIKNLHESSLKFEDKGHFPYLKDWLSIFDKNWDVPHHYLSKGRFLRDELLQTTHSDTLLHGDLHHDNILKNGKDWVVIDPKGVIGDPSYEIGAFIRNPMPDLLKQTNLPQQLKNRIKICSQLLNFPEERILKWCFVQSLLSWIWALEDADRPDNWSQLTTLFYKLDNLF